MITGITSTHRDQVKALILDKLNDFWTNSPDEQWVPIDDPDGIASMSEQAADWISNECRKLGQKICEETYPTK